MKPKRLLLWLIRQHTGGLSSLCPAIFLTLFLLALPSPAAASARTALVCDHAAQVASRESGVPLSVLRSITRTETGRARGGTLQPWPWTVNMEGVGKWFDTEDAARAYVFRHFKRGARSFDVGCFQINYKWHGDAFRSIDEMFDPLANARYAARFLQGLHAESGDWSKAAGAYHSRTPKYATRYRTRFDKIRADMQRQGSHVLHTGKPSPYSISQIAEPRENRFPLLRPGGSTAGRGSLVPINSGSAQALINFTAGQGS